MTVYKPREDSHLLEKAILEKDLTGKKCLDMGTGTGIIASKMVDCGAEKVLAVDKNPDAVEKASEKLGGNGNVEIFKSDLFSNVEGKFDLIAFNPPYLPEGDEDIDDNDIWEGGKSGEELTEKFLKQSKEHLTEDGEVIFIVSSSSGFDHSDYEIVDTKQLWFEDLYVLKTG